MIIEVVERLGALDHLPERALQVVWGREVAAVDQDAHGVTVGFADGGQRRVGWLVGCDGAHSRVRQLVGVGFSGVPLAERFLLVDVHADLPVSRRTIYAWLDGDTVFGAFPLPGRDMWRLMVPTADPGTEADGMTGEAVLAEVTRQLRERTGCDPSLLGAPEWVTSFRVHRRLADGRQRDRGTGAAGQLRGRTPAGGRASGQVDRCGEQPRPRKPPLRPAAAGPGRRPTDEQAVDATAGLGEPVPAEGDLSERSLGPPRSNVVLGPGAAARRPGTGLRVRTGRRRWTDHPACRARQQVGAGAARRSVGDEHAAVVAKRLGDDAVATLVADHDANGEIMVVRPDAHLGWRGRPDPDALDRWLTAVTRQGRGGAG